MRTDNGMKVVSERLTESIFRDALDPHALDEVAGGLTDPEVAQLVEIVRGVNAEGIAVIWIEHVVRALTAAVSRLICLAGGQFVGDGEPSAVLANPAVREVFLGSELTASLSGGTLTAEVGDPGEGS